MNMESFSNAVNFPNLITVSLIGSVLVVLAMGLHQVLNRQVSAKWLHLVWLVVLARFVLLIVPESPTSFMNFVSDYYGAEQANLTEVNPERYIFSDLEAVPQSEFDLPVEDAGETTTQQSKFPFTAWQIAFAIWSIGFILMTMRLFFNYWQLRQTIANTEPASEEIKEAFSQLKTEHRLSRKTKVRITDELSVPAMAGCFHPMVLIPRWCLQELTSQQLKMVLLHELVHIRRRDGLVQLASHAIAIVHWFNPLVRVANSYLEACREISCDKEAIEIASKSDTNAARVYGETILNIASHQSDSSKLCPVLMGGFVGRNENLIKQRIAMLVRPNSKQRLGFVAGLSSLIILIAIGFTSAQSAQQETLPEFVRPIGNGLDLEIKSKLLISPEPMQRTDDQLADALKRNMKLSMEAPTWKESSFPWPTEFVSKPIQETSVLTQKNEETSNEFSVSVGSSEKLTLPFRIPEVMVSDPKIASITPITPTTLLVTGLKSGTTTVTIHNEKMETFVWNINVMPNLRALKVAVKNAFPSADIKLWPKQGNIVVLSGTVSQSDSAKLLAFVHDKCKLPIENKLQIERRMVAIKVRVYEISKTKYQQLGIDHSKLFASDKKPISVAEALGNARITTGGPIGVGVVHNKSFSAYIEALEKHAVAKLLDQPVLVTTHGRPAEFLSGGEVPITVHKDGKQAIEFRHFGTRIQSTPYVHSDGTLTMEIRAERSELAKDLSGNTGVPGFRVRRFNTGVNMDFGETVAAIGNYKELTKDGKKEETELLFLLTPRIIKKVASRAPIEPGNTLGNTQPQPGYRKR